MGQKIMLKYWNGRERYHSAGSSFRRQQITMEGKEGLDLAVFGKLLKIQDSGIPISMICLIEAAIEV
jgi:hypothetical protein